MSHLVLAREWRPKKFEQVYGQDLIVRALQSAIFQGKVSHSYIFNGTRGVGKTTMARIFAKTLNCKNLKNVLAQSVSSVGPCLTCSSCLDFENDQHFDLLEIDGASNNSVEDIRDLISKINYSPAHGPYRVFIIDEVHMLSIAAFNALLKTLEEPPSHVVFILATTEIEKIPATILSRCLRFDFNGAKLTELKQLMLNIFTAEKIQIESDDILQDLVRVSKGSYRDSLSTLEKLRHLVVENSQGQKILTRSLMEETLGLVSKKDIYKLWSCILSCKWQEAIECFEQLLNSGLMVDRVVSDLISEFSKIILFPSKIVEEKEKREKGTLEGIYELFKVIEDEEIHEDELMWIFENFSKDCSWILKCPNPDDALLVLLKKLSLRRTFFGIQKKNIKQSSKTEKPTNKSVVQQDPKDEKQSQSEKDSSHEIAKNPQRTESINFIKEISLQDAVLGSMLEHAQFSIKQEGETVHVTFTFSSEGQMFYQEVHLEEKRELIKTYILNIYNQKLLGIKKIELEILISHTDEKGKKIRTEFQKIEEKQRESLELSKKSFIGHPNLIHAQKIFGATLSDVKINK